MNELLSQGLFLFLISNSWEQVFISLFIFFDKLLMGFKSLLSGSVYIFIYQGIHSLDPPGDTW